MTGQQRFFAFLRAINIGDRRLTNEELKEPFIALGLRDVDAYQAAGNITFHADESEDTLVEMLEATLSATYGFEVPVFLRTEAELRTSVGAPRFSPQQLRVTEGRIQVSFMRNPPGPEMLSAAMALIPDDDVVLFAEREWFWLPKAGVSESSLPVASVEKVVGPMTMRTVGTVERMLRRY